MNTQEVISQSIAPPIQEEGLETQLHALKSQGKRLRDLRLKRDQLREELAAIMAEIHRTVDTIDKLTTRMADEPIEEPGLPNGKGKGK